MRHWLFGLSAIAVLAHGACLASTQCDDGAAGDAFCGDVIAGGVCQQGYCVQTSASRSTTDGGSSGLYTASSGSVPSGSSGGVSDAGLSCLVTVDPNDPNTIGMRLSTGFEPATPGACGPIEIDSLTNASDLEALQRVYDKLDVGCVRCAGVSGPEDTTLGFFVPLAIADETYLFPNYGACIAHYSGNPDCGAFVHKHQYCALDACAGCTDFDACSEQVYAPGGDCVAESFVSAARGTCTDDALERGNAQCGSSLRDHLDKLCGGNLVEPNDAGTADGG